MFLHTASRTLENMMEINNGLRQQSDVFYRKLPCARDNRRGESAHAAKCRCKKEFFRHSRRLTRGQCIARARACSQADRMWKKPNKNVVHQEEGGEEEGEEGDEEREANDIFAVAQS